MSSTDADVVIDPQTIKELHLFEAAISDVDTEVTAKQYLMSREIFAARQQTIAKIPSFWAVTFDNAATELEAAVTQHDLEVFSAALTSLEVTRPEIPASAKPSDMGLDKFGEPRSLQFTFRFGDNEWFSDKELTKTFYFRYGKDGSAGLVSEPIKINWKSPAKDLTRGLSDAALAFWHAQKSDPSQELDGVLANDARHARDAAAKKAPEYVELAKKLEDNVEGALSFFNFFSYRGRWISAAEHVEAKAEMLAKRKAAQAGQEMEEDDDDEDDDEDFTEEAVETFPAGHEVAVTIAEDIFPNAIDYFMGNHIDSDIELDDDDEDDEDEEMEG
ncbi:putative nap family protein [Rosellinia necatrix]|uniref:Putative nap family protein n=1 Tax=Rosellinia necatrix TaxID=77044 RepID=A0A1W2TW51_ROSNE|nr:putative nap family protein [Rosellinia necatrix]